LYPKAAYLYLSGTLAPEMYILAPHMDIAQEMDILAPKMYILPPKMSIF